MSDKKEYIEREAAVAFLENMAASRYLIQCFENKERFPAADVEEIRHGKWIERGTGEIYCSVCGRVQGNTNRPNYDTVEEMTLLERYCSGCGAKMDGKGENDV